MAAPDEAHHAEAPLPAHAVAVAAPRQEMDEQSVVWWRHRPRRDHNLQDDHWFQSRYSPCSGHALVVDVVATSVCLLHCPLPRPEFLQRKPELRMAQALVSMVEQTQVLPAPPSHRRAEQELPYAMVARVHLLAGSQPVSAALAMSPGAAWGGLCPYFLCRCPCRRQQWSSSGRHQAFSGWDACIAVANGPQSNIT